MNKFYLCVSKNTKTGNDEVDLSPSNPNTLSYSGSCIKSSPIFPVFSEIDKDNIFPNSTAIISFIYTLDTFYCLGRIVNQLDKKDIPEGIFISHGIASIVVFHSNKRSINKIFNLLNDYISGYESWKVKNGIISDTDIRVNDPVNPPLIEWPIKLLNDNEKNVVNEIISSLRTALFFASIYAHFCSNFLKSIQNNTEEIICKLLYLKNKMPLRSFKVIILKIYKNDSLFNFKEYLLFLDGKKKDIRQNNILQSQLSDELIQISAILKSINSQAFCGTAPLRDSSYRSGEFSLLGIGLAYSSIIAIYDNVWKIFNDYQIDIALKFEFPKLTSPTLGNVPTEYEKWHREITTYRGLEVATKNPTNRNYHLLYFSNRLGFRETKHSVTSAYQSIRFGILPSWSFSTLFHEYLHAINRVLFTITNPSIDSDTFDKIYDLYKKRFKENIQPPDLLSFLKIIIMSTAHSLECFNNDRQLVKKNIQNHFSRTHIIESIEKWYHDIDELMVHIFDFNYFFQRNSELYIKSIWSSWLELPFTLSRSNEYLFRTICTISSSESGDRGHRFKWSVNKIIATLEELKNYSYTDSDKIDVVLSGINDSEISNNLKLKFFEICPLIDATSHFLICPQIKLNLMQDPESYASSEGSHSYHFNVGCFEELRISSPVRFIMEMKKRFFDGEIEINNDSMSYLTLWYMSALTSSLLRMEDDS